MLAGYARRRSIYRARNSGTSDADRQTAEYVSEQFVDWLITVASQFASRRNIAVALWAIAELDGPHASHSVDLSTIDRLLGIYRERLTAAEKRREDQAKVDVKASPSADDVTRADMGVEHLISQDGQSLSRLLDTRAAELSQFPEVVSQLGSAAESPPEKGAVGREFAGGRTDRTAYGSHERAPMAAMGVVYFATTMSAANRLPSRPFKAFLDQCPRSHPLRKEALTCIQLEKHPNIVQARLIRVTMAVRISCSNTSGPENLGSDCRAGFATAASRRKTPSISHCRSRAVCAMPA